MYLVILKKSKYEIPTPVCHQTDEVRKMRLTFLEILRVGGQNKKHHLRFEYECNEYRNMLDIFVCGAKMFNFFLRIIQSMKKPSLLNRYYTHTQVCRNC